MSDAPCRVLALSGASRRESLNSKLLRLATAALTRRGAIVEFTTLADFAMPVYDGDLEDASGPPEGALQLAERLAANEALLIASPEYNFSVPGALKNAIDWISRVKPNRLAGKTTLLISASPSLVGANRGLWALRVPLEALGARVLPEMFSLAQAHEAFDAEGKLVKESLATRLDEMVGKLQTITRALRDIG